MVSLQEYLSNSNLFTESVKPENGGEWEVYVDGSLDKTFTEHAKKWKRRPEVGKGWYAGGTVFKIVKIDGNKVYTESE